jgi:hypothetical protein
MKAGRRTKMKVLINFCKGFRATANLTRMVLLLFIINLVFSLILAFPLYRSLKDSFGSSLVGEKMARGFDYLWWEEFRDQSRGLETTFTPSVIGKGAILDNIQALVETMVFNFPPLLFILVVLYIILHTFLAGGILSTFNQERQEFTMKGFFEGAGFLFSRFFYLTVLSWIPFLAVGIFLAAGFESMVSNVARSAISEIKPFYFGLISSAIIFFILLLLQMVFDYARIKIVLEKKHDVLESAIQAFAFALRHPFVTVSLYAFLFLIQAAVTVVYILAKEALPQSNFLEVLAAFFLQQIFIFVLIWLRCWLYSSQLELYRYLR